MGEGDLHDTKYDHERRTVDLLDFYDMEQESSSHNHCLVHLDVYPSDMFHEAYHGYIPAIFSAIVAVLFVIMAFLFGIYDRKVHDRNQEVEGAAQRSTAIVSSLFPSTVRDRLFAEKKREQSKNDNGRSSNTLKTFVNSFHKSQESFAGSIDGQAEQSDVIADLFPETTICFADIVGCKFCFQATLLCAMLRFLTHLYC